MKTHSASALFWNAVLVCAFFFTKVFAQDCTTKLSGRVLDLHDNQPLINAKVTLRQTNQQLLTDEQGRFVFFGLCSQPYDLRIEHPSCIAREQRLAPPFTGEKRIYLEHHIEALEEIIITDRQKKKTTATGVEKTLDKATLDRYRSQSFGDALAQLAGVSKIKTGNAIVKPMVHGFSGTRLALVQDGIRLQDHEWGADHAPSVDLNGVDEVQLIKGANALRYGGDVVGGVIQLKARKFRPENRLYGFFQTGLKAQGEGVSLLSDVTKTMQTGHYLATSIALKTSGDLRAPDYVLSNTGNREQHAKMTFGRNTLTRQWQLGYQYFSKTAGILSAAHLGTLGDLARAIESSSPLTLFPWTRAIGIPKQQTEHHNFMVKVDNRHQANWRWEVQYGFQWNNRKEFDLRRGDLKFSPALDLRLMTHDLQVHTSLKTADEWTWNAGLVTQLQDNYSDPATGVRRLIPDYLRIKGGAYVVGAYSPNNAFAWEGGLRYDYDRLDTKKYYRISDWHARGYSPDYDATIIARGNASSYLTQHLKQFHNLSATVGIKTAIAGWGDLRWSSGYSMRSPNPAELFSDGLHHALATIERGDLRLVQEKAWKNVLSLELSSPKTAFQWDVHHSWIKDFIQLVPNESGFDLTRNSAFLVRDYQQLPEVFFVGTDLTVHHQWTEKIAMEANGAWLRAQTAQGHPLIDMPPLRWDAALRFDKVFNKDAELALTVQHIARQSRFPNTDFQYSFIENNVLVQRTIDISSPPRAATIFGAEVAANLWSGATFSIVIDNIFNLRYRDYLNRLRYFADETGRNLRINLTYSFR